MLRFLAALGMALALALWLSLCDRYGWPTIDTDRDIFEGPGTSHYEGKGRFD